MGRTSRLVPSSTPRAISTAGRNGAPCTGARCACAAAWVGGSARTTGARTASTHNRRAANIVVIDQLSLVPIVQGAHEPLVSPLADATRSIDLSPPERVYGRT